MKKIMRSRTKRMLAGVIGGISDATGINVGLLRIGYLLLMFATAFIPLAAVYVLLMFILPNEQAM